MQYTVSSRGRSIGTTALEPARDGGPARVGWLRPDAEGERLLLSAGAPDALALTLHRPDGSPVPAASVGVWDTHAALVLAEWARAVCEVRGAAPAWVGDAPDAADDGPPDRPSPDGTSPGGPPHGPWAPDDEPVELPRWRIVVVPADGEGDP